MAARGMWIGVHFYRNEEAAKETLEKVRTRGSDGHLVRCDVGRPEEIAGMFAEVKARFGRFDIFVSNARPKASEFFQRPMDVTLEQWDAAANSQGKAFLIAAREASWANVRRS
jgi:NAD(P)-dependent dehydrogenase (short-subunit alcohol dehydrogenase family)